MPDQTLMHGLPHGSLRPEIGAVVHLDKPALLSGRYTRELRRLLEQRGVLLFPAIGLSEDEQVAFTKTLGTFVPDRPDGAVTPITIDPAAGRSADYTRSAFFWHFDGYMNDVPILASLLCCEVPSAVGGDTEFCNTYAAFEALPAERRDQLEGLQAVHAMAGAQLSVDPEPSYATFCEWLAVPRNVLPLVWTHRSGRRSLVIGNTAVNVIAMDPLAGLELLVWLRDWATQERFTYRHSWRAGDAVLWDNTGTLHRVTPYQADSGRSMRRTKLAGEEPFV
jgi:alpha-ketoglutarate-dependent taurine dioxygenase